MTHPQTDWNAIGPGALELPTAKYRSKRGENMTKPGVWLSDGSFTRSTHKAAWDATPLGERKAIAVVGTALAVTAVAVWSHVWLVAFGAMVVGRPFIRSADAYTMRLRYFIRMQATRGHR